MEESTKKLETMEENVKEQLKDFDTCYEIHFTPKDISEIAIIMDECFYNGIVAVYKNRISLGAKRGKTISTSWNRTLILNHMENGTN